MSVALPPGVTADLPPDDQLTPLFRQYAQLKAQYPGSLLLYRLGDFYEMFGYDAVTASGVLGLTLTSRACGKEAKLAMAGVPHHSSARYIKRLVEAGHSCAICEQIEDPAQAKGLVERDVTRVVTAGTLVEEEFLDDDSGNFLAVAARRGNVYGVAILESTGGSVELFELEGAGPLARPESGGAQGRPPSSISHLLDLMLKCRPAEVLLPAEVHSSKEVVERLRVVSGPSWRRYESVPGEREVAQFLHGYFQRESLEPFGIEAHGAAQAALYALIRYLRETFKVGQLRLYPRLVPLQGVLHLDSHAVDSLDLVSGEATLYGHLNRCSTAPGRRLLRRRLLAPFADAEPITQRQGAVALLSGQRSLTAALRELLGQIPDIERIAQRVALGRSHPKEVAALGYGLHPLGKLKSALGSCGDGLLAELAASIADFHLLARRIAETLADDPPLKLSDGGVIRAGADKAVDELRELVEGGDAWFAQYEQQQRERTGIRTLKVKRTDAFGWFIEVGRGAAASVPEDYQRRQTLVNNERYTTPELAARDAQSRSAGGQLLARERELFELLGADIAGYAEQLAAAAQAAAEADVLLAFAEVAREQGWVRPELLGLETEADQSGVGQAAVPVKNTTHETVHFPAAPEDFHIYRRQLPHWRMSGSVYFITWRVNESQPDLPSEARDIVLENLRHWDGKRYHLIGAVVMNDHVHVVIWPIQGNELSQITHTFKSFTANRIQRELGWQGAVWQDESWDRIVRDEDELYEKLNYINNNPAKRWPACHDYEWTYINLAAADQSWTGTAACPTATPLPCSQASDNFLIELVNARHPLVEAAVGSRYYTPNDCYLDGTQQQVMVLTGPNMGGKSTFLRMVALHCVLCQIGSFVPAEAARLPVLRRIYTRVGAHDRLSRGQSTFMVEMVETAEILNTAGPGSLVILDEVGRGTSTYDGISIAKAVLEHLHEHPARPLVLFATHFFELTDLALALPRVRNFHVEVASSRELPGELGSPQFETERSAAELGTSFVFLYKVNPGPASDSFGIEVAALAGLPDGVVTRARQILRELEDTRELARERARQAVQLGLFRA